MVNYKAFRDALVLPCKKEKRWKTVNYYLHSFGYDLTGSTRTKKNRDAYINYKYEVKEREGGGSSWTQKVENLLPQGQQGRTTPMRFH